MSGERRLEYDRGPSLEDEPADSAEADEPADEGREREERTDDGGLQFVVAPWKAGALFGASAFAVVFAVIYQLTGSRLAAGFGSLAENEPSQWALAGVSMLASHGGTIEYGGEPIQLGRQPAGVLTSDTTALVPVVVFVLAGYLLVRYVRLETSRDAGLAIGVTIASYVALATALARLATWAPEEGEFAPEADPDVVAVAVDGSLLFSMGSSVILFVTLGAAVAALPRLLECAPIATTNADTTS
ncbi:MULTISPECIES: hypothetical protein [Natrialbaceae]|uniref:hypothetical protein n=1 Tax=Natrialbaceae TaxID=1644061 RepID=UPI00207CFB02|nr:hypothetical protein [Natronococcus sp. CG52]